MSDDSPDSLGDDPTYVGRGKEREDQSLGDQSTYAGSNESSLSDLDGLGGSLEDGLNSLEIVDLESRYTIIRPIGKGGMGEVFLATDTRLNRKVAIKRIKDELTTPAAAARFLTEAKSIAALSHPYIVQVYDYGRAKDGPFLIMEYVEGENLQQVCNQGVMALEDAIDLACKLCDALSKAHSLGIIHRDIKPANILMTEEGWPKISDFGLAKSTSDHGHTMTGTALGTLDFMPPEQRRDASAVDHRSDLWSLAATIYQMVTGEPPKVIDLEDVPGALRSVLAKALKTKPESRYQSAVELGTALAEGMAAPEQPVVIPMAELGAGECPKCHVKNESSRKFCSGCGESLRLTCMKCELDIPVWENFCGECGGNQSDLLATRALELVQIRSEAEQLRSDQQYEGSIQLAQKLAAVEDDRLLEYKSWADDFLRSTEELWEREKQSAQRHLDESKKHRRAEDYSAAIKAIEAIPEPLRSAEIKSYLEMLESALAKRFAELDQTRIKAERFRSNHQYKSSVESAQQLAAIKDDQFLEYKIWGGEFLRSTEELWEREKQSAKRHFEESKEHLRLREYSAAIKAIEAIPEPLRSAEIKPHLQTVLAKRCAELDQIRIAAKQFRANHQYESSMQLVQQLAAIEDDQFLEYKTWGEEFLRATEELWKQGIQSAQRFFEESKEHFRLGEFSSAIKAIEAIPEGFRSAEIKSHLLQVLEILAIEYDKRVLAKRDAELDQIRIEAEQFRTSHQYESSMQLVQQLAAIKDDQFLEYKTWAEEFLCATEELWKRGKQSAQRYFEESKKHRSVFDYSAAIKAIEAIPEPLRSTEIKSHLMAVESDHRELIELMPTIKKRVENREVDGLLELVDRAIELRGGAGNLAKLQQQLNQRKLEEQKRNQRQQE